jgi:hypothetical protein
LQLEAGEISEEKYSRAETEIFRELREIENRKREMAGVPPESKGIEASGSTSASISADLSYGRRHHEQR